MKTYIGNRIMCLAQPEDRESQAGYNVLYVDGSEAWLTKEIFEFEYRQLEEMEIQMIISTIVNDTISEAELTSILAEDEDLPGISGETFTLEMENDWVSETDEKILEVEASDIADAEYRETIEIGEKDAE